MINVNFDSNIIYTPYYEKWVAVKSGIYNNTIIILQDQNFNIIVANDSNILISLMLKQGGKKIKNPNIESTNIIKQ